jgi:hypothetical protein
MKTRKLEKPKDIRLFALHLLAEKRSLIVPEKNTERGGK